MSDWIPPWERRLEGLPEAPEADLSPFERYGLVEEPAPVESWFGNEVTLYGIQDGMFEPYSMTGEEWVDEALRPKEDLIEEYGLDNIDIIEQLQSRGYDYTYIDFDGEERSGLWRDWRDAYAESHG
jgi:hypothetical protein